MTGSPAALQALVTAIRAALDRTRDGTSADVAAAVAAAVRPSLGRPDLLPEDVCDPGPAGSRETVLHVEPDGRFSVVALAWAPGERTPPHDHRAWGVVGVHRGVERTVRYDWSAPDERLVVAGERRAATGEVDVLVPPADVHRVTCEGDAPAVSLHVHGLAARAPGAGVRRLYAVPPPGR